MNMLLTILGCLGVFLGIVGIAALGFWLAYGRKKKTEDESFALFKPMAIYKASSSNLFNVPRHR